MSTKRKNLEQKNEWWLKSGIFSLIWRKIQKIYVKLLMLLYHNLSHIFIMAEEILIPPANHHGRALDWTFLEAFPTMELLMASCHESGFKKGRINDTAISTKRYFNCKISGCPKRLRSVTLLCEIAEEEEDFLQRFSLEDNSSVLHQHDALELPMRGN